MPQKFDKAILCPIGWKKQLLRRVRASQGQGVSSVGKRQRHHQRERLSAADCLQLLFVQSSQQECQFEDEHFAHVSIKCQVEIMMCRHINQAKFFFGVI